MTIVTTTNRWAYVGNGITTVFAYTNLIFAASDLKVYLAGVLQGAGFTVSNAGVVSGGNVSFAVPPAAGVAVVIVRDVPATQEIDYVPNDPFPAETHERGLDKLTILAQQLASKLTRQLGLAEGDAALSIGPLPEVAGRASRYLAFDAAGAPMASAGPLGASGPVSPFIDTLLDDAGPAAARLTLNAAPGAGVSVRDFGAVGDGLTDDTVAINAAMASGSPMVFLPAGTYKTSAPLIPHPGGHQCLTGTGSKSRILNASVAGNIFQVGNTSSLTRNYRFENFGIWSSVAKTSGAAFACTKLDQCHWAGVEIGELNDYGADGHRLWNGIELKGHFRCSIDSNCKVTVANNGVILSAYDAVQLSAEVELEADFIFCGGRAIWIGGGTGGIYINGEISRCRTGVHIDDALLPGTANREIFLLSRAIVDSSDDYACVVDNNGCSLLEIDGTWLTSTGRFNPSAAGVGLYVAPSTGVKPAVRVTGAEIYNNRVTGVVVGDGDVFLRACVIRNQDGNGVHFPAPAADHSVVEGCDIFANGGFGVVIAAGVDNFRVADNNIYGNVGGAIANASGFGATKVVRGNSGYVTENKGAAVLTTDGGGDIAVAHGLIAAPNSVLATLQAAAAPWTCQAHTFTATTFKVRVFNTAGAVVPATGVNVAWQASI